MEKLSIGSIHPLNDGGKAIIKEVLVSFEVEKDNSISTSTLSLEEFQQLLKNDSVHIEPGQKFTDEDQSSAEIIEVSANLILYKKQWGAESWKSSITKEEFLDKIRTKRISLLQ